jgi:hypothetical protein
MDKLRGAMRKYREEVIWLSIKQYLINKFPRFGEAYPLEAVREHVLITHSAMFDTAMKDPRMIVDMHWISRAYAVPLVEDFTDSVVLSE